MLASTSFPIAVVVWDQKYKKKHIHMSGEQDWEKIHISSPQKRGTNHTKPCNFTVFWEKGFGTEVGWLLVLWNGGTDTMQKRLRRLGFFYVSLFCAPSGPKSHQNIAISIYLVIQCDLFRMLKWPFQRLSDLQTRGWKGHFESPGTVFLLTAFGLFTSLNCSCTCLVLAVFAASLAMFFKVLAAELKVCIGLAGGEQQPEGDT